MRLSRKREVIVAGGGTAGFAAALAAKRNGADALIIEKSGFVGGLIVSGLPFQGFRDEQGERIVGGIFEELIQRLTNLGGYKGPILSDTVHNVFGLVDPPLARCVTSEMIEEAGVDILLHSYIVDTLVEGDKVKGVVIENKSGKQIVNTDLIIDATGDGDVAAYAGVPYLKGRKENGVMQTPALLFRLGGVDIAETRQYLQENPDQYLYAALLKPGLNLTGEFLDRTPVFSGFQKLVEEARLKGDFPVARDRVLFCTLPKEEQVLINTTKALFADGTDAESLTKAEKEMIRQVIPIANFFKKYIPGFKFSYLLDIAPELGLRETRHIRGEYTLTEEDVLQGRKFADRIAKGSHFIDIHHGEDKGWTTRHIKDIYDIPYRCLVPKGIENLLVTGRCISATHEAAASVRIMATCIALGEAAGIAAALALKAGKTPRELDVSQLQKKLVEQGAII